MKMAQAKHSRLQVGIPAIHRISILWIFALSACDNGQVTQMQQRLGLSDLDEATANIACGSQKLIEEKYDIAVTGTEKIVVATGAMTESDISASKSQLATIGKGPMDIVKSVTNRPEIRPYTDCDSFGRQIADLGRKAGESIR